MSHRIDINSMLVNSPIYYPVRCGAASDRKGLLDIAGDDTGNNISDKRMTFCEFTVQYWAWKNAECDYYGLCHYRRYLSFAKKRFRPDRYNIVHEYYLTPHTVKKYRLADYETMRSVIEKYDMVVNEAAPVEKMPVPGKSVSTVLEMWRAHDGHYLKSGTLELMTELIREKFPEYYDSAMEYLNGGYHRGFNCYVMKRKYFNMMCEFQFAIMSEVESRLDTTGYTQTMKRTPGFVGEILYGIFTYHLITRVGVKYKECQLVFFENTEKINSRARLAAKTAEGYLDKGLRTCFDSILPIGSERRERVKKIVFKVTKRSPKGEASIK